MDDDSDYYEETTYVVFDLGKAVRPEYIREMNEKAGGCRITGLEEGTPYLQVGNLTFEGEVDETIGTHLLFAVEESKNKQTVEYFTSTETIIKMDSVNLERRDVPVPDEQIDSENEKEEIYDSSVLDAIL